MNEMLSNYPILLDVKDVATILNVTPQTVRRLTREHKIPSIKVGHLTRIPKDKLIEYIDTTTC